MYYQLLSDAKKSKDNSTFLLKYGLQRLQSILFRANC